jgi:hypothetical protein
MTDFLGSLLAGISIFVLMVGFSDPIWHMARKRVSILSGMVASFCNGLV